MATPGVRERMAKLCVGLGAPADHHEGGEIDLVKYFTKQFAGEPSLPFVAWLTHDWKWVHGFAGSRTRAQFLEDLAVVEASPLVPASAEVAARLLELAAEADGHAEAERWAEVVKTAKKGEALRGRCEERARLDDVMQEARDWADDQLYDAVKSVADGGKVADARKAVGVVAKVFSGQPEGDEAEKGLKALAVAARIAKLTGDKAAKARGAAAVEYAGTRWFDLFRQRDSGVPPEPGTPESR